MWWWLSISPLINNISWLFDEIPREGVQHSCISLGRTLLSQIREFQKETLPELGKEKQSRQQEKVRETGSEAFQSTSFKALNMPKWHILGYHFLSPQKSPKVPASFLREMSRNHRLPTQEQAKRNSKKMCFFKEKEKKYLIITRL